MTSALSRRGLAVAVLVGTATGLAAPAGTAAAALGTDSAARPAVARPPAPNKQQALAAGDAVAKQGLGKLSMRSGESFVRTGEAQGPKGIHYLTYTKSYRGLPVVGADAVVAADESGAVLDTTSSGDASTAVASITPKINANRAAAVAKSRFTKIESSEAPRLVVAMVNGTKATLAWHAFVQGVSAGKPSAQNVYVDAATGKVLWSQDLVMHADATGNGHLNGKVQFTTTGSGSSYTMTSTAAPGLKCGGQNGSPFTDSDNVWGNGSGTDMPTACADTMYAGEVQGKMMKEWANRNGVNGQGNFYPARVGLTDVNAYWNGQYANFGRNQANSKQATSIDVVAHEFGHGVFQFSGSGGGNTAEQGGMNESTGDILGAATECYQDNGNVPDKCDYEVGEMINLAGQGPIRYMYDPNKIGDPNCATQITSSTEVHRAAGPQNHWFFLLANGSSPTNGQPKSPICSGGPSSVTGIGVQKATNIFINGLQRKTSSWSHKNARVATLNATKTLYPNSCTEFNAVKDAWAAVAVPTQSSEPTCTITNPTNDYSIGLNPTSGSVQPGASVTSTVATQTTAGNAQNVSLSASGLPSGATASFSPASVQTGASSTMTLKTAASTPAGTYNVTVTASGTPIKTASYSLTVGNGNPNPTTPPDVDVAQVQSHLQSLQNIANNNGGNRRAGTAGYTASVDYVVGKLQAAGYTVSKQRCTSCTYPSDNIIADWPGGDANKTYMFGAHLDGVAAGPGMNDNGSGSAALLENALVLAQKKPTMDGHIRFAWWTDEEQGLNGSKFYVKGLSSTQKSQIKAYYNFDMVASTNGGYFINHVTSAAAAPMKAYWDSLGLKPEENTEGAGRSDDYSFEQVGIPTSGYAMGASARKTSAQATKWGGTSGSAYDPCYHASCDKYPANVNVTGLNRSADGIAYTIWKQAVGSGDPTPTNDFSVSVSPAAGTVAAGSSVSATVATATTSGQSQSVSLSASGLPSGATASFNPSSVQSGSSSTMSIQTSASTPAGTYSVSVTGTGSAVRTAPYTLTVTGDTPPGGGATYTNNTDYRILDGRTASSPITSTYAATVSSVKVSYDIYHSCEADFGVVLVAPDGRQYELERPSAGACRVRDGFVTGTVPITPTSAQGQWTLKVTDYYTGYTGTLYSFKIVLP